MDNMPGDPMGYDAPGIFHMYSACGAAVHGHAVHEELVLARSKIDEGPAC